MFKKDGLIAFERRYEEFLRLRSTDDLASLLGFAEHTLLLQSVQPQYHHFSIPKKDGTRRWLEDPNQILKAIQARLNDFLQSAYWFLKTEAAYGFVDNPTGYPAPRHIHSNAEQHLGKPWLLNADLEDFFHAVKAETVMQVFSSKPFNFEEELARLLTGLTTNLGRLPMGAPTSPVLSNLAVRDMDNSLLLLAKEQGWTFTRYADDMSFSGQEEIDVEHFVLIANLVCHHGYQFNPAKTKYFGPEDVKLVTGLVLGDGRLELPADFTEGLKTEIGKLAHVMQANYHFGHKRSAWVEKYMERLNGLLNFAELTLGPNDPRLHAMQRAYLDAISPKDDHDSLSWADFPYV